MTEDSDDVLVGIKVADGVGRFSGEDCSVSPVLPSIEREIEVVFHVIIWTTNYILT